MSIGNELNIPLRSNYIANKDKLKKKFN